LLAAAYVNRMTNRKQITSTAIWRFISMGPFYITEVIATSRCVAITWVKGSEGKG